ncbi:MAG: hypothetical protein IJA08_07660 [Clostridia bacterium]|nr:hypothetical protein [Clostridia bacterium]
MNCFYHEERNASALCQVCGKGLCSDCATVISIPICKECLSEHIYGEKSKMLKCIVVGLILGIGCSIIMKNLSGLLFAWVPFGWMALSAITPKVFLVMPIVGWIAYFAIKFVLAFLIGWVALPIKLYRWMRIFNLAKKVLE